LAIYAALILCEQLAGIWHTSFGTLMPRDGVEKAASDQDIYDRVFAAILDRRLRPGAHLREAELAEMFGVSRTKVRQALAKLIANGVVEVRANRGAAVAAPSRAQARQVFALRALLEPAIAAQCALNPSAAQIDRLRAHVAAEDAARAKGDEAALIRATGEFHLKLAKLLANPVIDKVLLDLEALTCLSILSYARAEGCACPDEHRPILDAVIAQDPERARQLMARHIDHVRADLDLNEPRKSPSSLAHALALPDARGRRKTPAAGPSD
jgi:DNA-binding GntR family transcriptional regulator